MKIVLYVNDSAGNTTELSDSFPILHPLKFVKGSSAESLLKITDSSNKSLIVDVYDKALKAYHITDVAIPTNVSFDATDIRVENYGYELDNVEWDFDNDGTYEKVGMKAKYELIEEKRYTFRVRYTFADKEKNIVSSIGEKIIFEPEMKDVNLTLKLTQDSEYAPTNIHVDGSASIPKEGTITKFMYDFGEGK